MPSFTPNLSLYLPGGGSLSIGGSDEVADIDTLARLAQITPPEQRSALRADLRRLPADQRSAWLQARLQQ